MAVKLLVDGLPPSFKEEDLCALFRLYGSVLSAHIFPVPTSTSCRAGAIYIATADQAVRALQQLDGVRIENAVLRLLWATPLNQPATAVPPSQDEITLGM